MNTDLFKITGGFGYSTQPTLTYTPLQGENFIQRLLSPLTLDKLMLLYRSGWNIGRLFRLCIQRLNDVKNAPRASGPAPEEAPQYREFSRVLDLLRELERRDGVELAYEAYPPTDSPPRLVLEVASEAQGKPETSDL